MFLKETEYYLIINVEDNLYKVGDVVFEKDYDLNYEKNIWQQNEIELGNFVDNKGLFLLKSLLMKMVSIMYSLRYIESWQKYSLIRNNGRIGKAILLSNVGIIAQKDREKTSSPNGYFKKYSNRKC